MATVDVSPAQILRLPPESPVRRLAVRLAAQDALHEERRQCQCGQVYRAVGRPPRFFNQHGEVFSCRGCGQPL